MCDVTTRHVQIFASWRRSDGHAVWSAVEVYMLLCRILHMLQTFISIIVLCSYISLQKVLCVCVYIYIYIYILQCCKRWVVQVLASATLLFIVVIKTLTEDLFIFKRKLYTPVIICTPLLLTSGAAPLQWWFPGVIERLRWEHCALLLTLQKAAPVILISKFHIMYHPNIHNRRMKWRIKPNLHTEKSNLLIHQP